MIRVLPPVSQSILDIIANAFPTVLQMPVRDRHKAMVTRLSLDLSRRELHACAA